MLQGVGDYKSVGLSLIGEQGTRLVLGAALAAAGLGVTGAYLGTPLSFIAMGVFCVIQPASLRGRYRDRRAGRDRQRPTGDQPVDAHEAAPGRRSPA